MNKFDIEALFRAAAEVAPINITSTCNAGSKISMGIVNSKENGKRISFSKALVKALGVTEKIFILPMKIEGMLLLAAKTFPFTAPAASVLQLRGDSGRKIAYASNAVACLTEVFQLDFSQHVSMTFSDIRIEERDGVTVGVVNMRGNNPPCAGGTEV